jgi:hypothetical protein
MRKNLLIGLILSVVVIVSAGVGYFFAQEMTVPDESELSTYSYMQPFLAGRTDFRGVRHNLDTGYYAFAFHTSHATAEEFFAVVHRQATAEQWQRVSAESTRQVYRRLSRAPWDDFYDQISLSYDAATGEVTFEAQPVPVQ